ncbi:hypothetical protein ACSHT2_33200 [Bradyrhizobium sp. PUT101]|uniref:hypothetical protein n=1 Tax=Bradyrhizobium sp. PUT101 TaxID=3447427 RepID=UPI003F867F9C
MNAAAQVVFAVQQALVPQKDPVAVGLNKSSSADDRDADPRTDDCRGGIAKRNASRTRTRSTLTKPLVAGAD